MSVNTTLEITDANFQELVLGTDKPVLIDFWAVWCGPCKMVGPIVDQLSQEYEGRAVVGKCDVDNNPEVAMKFGIRNIPTVVIIKNGEEVDRQVGATTKTVYQNKLEAQLG